MRHTHSESEWSGLSEVTRDNGDISNYLHQAVPARVTWRTSAHAALKSSVKKQDLKNLLTSIVTMSIIFENKSIKLFSVRILLSTSMIVMGGTELTIC